MNSISVSLDDIEATSYQALLKHNAAEPVARHVAHAIRIAEANGNLICGLYYLESYCTQLISGRVDGHADPVVHKPKSAIVHVDARGGFAQPAFAMGLAPAMDVLKECGTCSLAISHSHTCTSLGYFTEQIAEAGAIGIGLTNASAVVSPPGGNKAVLGTNPMAMAIPAKSGGVAFQFDQSTRSRSEKSPRQQRLGNRFQLVGRSMRTARQPPIQMQHLKALYSPPGVIKDMALA